MEFETPLDQIADEKFRALSEAIGNYATEKGIPGAAFGILENGVTHTNALGITHKDNPLPVTSYTTLFQIGSTTKTFTATLLMMLVDEGKLDLDAPVRTYLPDLQLADDDVAQHVSTRHLLTHVGGWDGDFFKEFDSGVDSVRKYVSEINTRQQSFPLGKVWAYNNAGFAIATRVIEVLAEKSYEQFVKERLLDPLGMDHTMSLEQDIMLHRFATGHYITEQGLTLPRKWGLDRSGIGMGGLCSTVDDQLKYARFHLDGGVTPDGTRLLSEAAFAEMQKKQHHVGYYIDYMGLSWMITERNGVRVVAHGGTMPGQIGVFFFAPEKQIAFTLLYNGTGASADLRGFATAKVYQDYFGIGKVVNEPLADQPAMQEYEATYRMAEVDFIVAAQADHLMVELQTTNEGLKTILPPAFAVQAYAPDLFIVTSENHPYAGTSIGFIRENGSIIALRNGVRAYPRLG
jgi:CubicO group peptidase (beta-lactamase class C family)